MRARKDIDWQAFSSALLVYRLGREIKGERAGAHAIALEAGVRPGAVRRALDWERFSGCKYETFRKLCALMNANPRRFELNPETARCIRALNP